MPFLKYICIFLSCSVLLVTVSYGVELGIPGSSNGYMLEVSGEIEEGDYDRIVELINLMGFPQLTRINSPGGDVREAMKLGEFYRNSLMTIMAGEQCNSSCFVWLVGATSSTANSGVGLHRPYFDRSWFSNLSPSEATTAYDQITEELTLYLNRMNVPIDIVNRMMSTPSNEVVFLTANEYENKLGSPPVFTEWIIANCGALSSNEQNDYEVISSIRTIVAGIEGGYLSASDERDRLNSLYIRRDSISAGYQQYLVDETVRIRSCRLDLVKEEQNSILGKLRNSPQQKNLFDDFLR